MALNLELKSLGNEGKLPLGSGDDSSKECNLNTGDSNWEF